MDANPALKRRRLNSTVNKPFKSPLKRTTNEASTSHATSPLSSTPVKTIAEDTPQRAATGPIHTGSRATPLRHRLHVSNPSTPSAPGDPATNLEIQDLMKQIRTLESSSAKKRQDMDVLTQALRLTTSTKDAELDALRIKWKAAARQAAEEVFATARDKVNRMGGVGAWRERQREASERRAGWDEPTKTEDNEEEIYDDEGELVEVIKHEREEVFEDEWDYDVEIRQENERRSRQDAGSDDDTFTMDMMLEMMNIELTVIGYDKKCQRWVG